MSGLYFHIPFCEKKCAYCNFFSVASKKYYNDFVFSLIQEIELKKNIISKTNIKTIYFGGGTPSILQASDIHLIFDKISSNINLSNVEEITFECNPDHINDNFVYELQQTPINRISLGVQSFYDEDLCFLERLHRKNQAEKSIDILQKNAFNNISIDLIFGIPGQDNHQLEKNLNYVIDKNIPHISTYALTLEERSIYFQKVKKGIKTKPEETSIEKYFYLINKILTDKKYIHYEISNYALKGKESKHNSNYWKGLPYYSFGPGAHSFDGEKRYWNISNLQKYIQELNKGVIPESYENLSFKDKLNEYIILNIRTNIGINLDDFDRLFGNKNQELLIDKSKCFIKKKMLIFDNNFLKTNEKGMLFSDFIARELMID